MDTEPGSGVWLRRARPGPVFAAVAAVVVITMAGLTVLIRRAERQDAWRTLDSTVRFVAATARFGLGDERAQCVVLAHEIAAIPGLASGQAAAAAHALLVDFRGRHPTVTGVALLGPHGSLWAQAGHAPGRADRAPARVGPAALANGPVFAVGLPRMAAGAERAPVWYVSRVAGHVRFVLWVQLRLARPRPSWAMWPSLPGTTTALLRADGRVEALWPWSPAGMPMVRQALRAVPAARRSGRFVTNRGHQPPCRVVFRRVAGYPLTALVLQTMRGPVGAWARAARLPAFLALLLLGALGALYRWTQERLAPVLAVPPVPGAREGPLAGGPAAGVIHSLADAVIVTDRQGRVDYLNPAAERLTGWPEGAIRGARLADVLPCLDEYDGTVRDGLDVCLKGDALGPEEVLLFTRKGRVILVERSAVPRRETQGVTGVVLTFRDASAKRTVAERLAHQARHDPLTGLPNRILYGERLAQAIAEAHEVNVAIALIFLDVDGFKAVNDSFGHSAGDQVLVLIGERLRRVMRAADTVARLGGDEFAVVLPGLSGPHDALPVVQKIMAIFAAPLTVALGAVRVGVSIGIAIYPRDGQDARTLAEAADAAMYEAKAAGKTTYRFFDQGAAPGRVSRAAALHERLRQALAHDEFCLFYQPQLRVADHQLVAVEALLRWMDPTEGVKYPSEFLLGLEEAGLMPALGLWVLSAACTQSRRWRDLGIAPLPIAVNLSVRECCEAGLATLLAQTLQTHGLGEGDLVVEFAEHVLGAEAAGGLAELRLIADRGIRLVVQNFGGSASSLGYLRDLRVEALKIEPEFIAGLGDHHKEAVVLAIIALGHALKLRVVASGVETVAQYRFLKEAGCDAIQGNFIAPPLNAEAATAYMRAALIRDG